MDRDHFFLSYGAELYNIALGLLGLLALALLAVLGMISVDHWLSWSALSSSFVLIPLALLGLRRLFPALSSMMEIKEPEAKAAEGAVASKQ